MMDQVGGGLVTAWDGYIEGATWPWGRARGIVRSWRTVGLPTTNRTPDRDPPGKPTKGRPHPGAQRPARQDDHEQGWIDNYFEPMQAYFRPESVPPPPGRPATGSLFVSWVIKPRPMTVHPGDLSVEAYLAHVPEQRRPALGAPPQWCTNACRTMSRTRPTRCPPIRPTDGWVAFASRSNAISVYFLLPSVMQQHR